MAETTRRAPPGPANFVFLEETGFHHVVQAALELTLGDLPTSASQSVGITSLSHCTQPLLLSHCVAQAGLKLLGSSDPNLSLPKC